MKKKNWAVAILAGLMAISLAGCGGGDKKAGAPKADTVKNGKK